MRICLTGWTLIALAGVCTGQTEEAKLLGSLDPVEARMGFSVAIDGTAAAAGAPQWRSSSLTSGAVVAFDRVGLGAMPWGPGRTLAASDRLAGDDFGWTVAIDGETLVTGAPMRDEGGEFAAGAAYVFERDPRGAWAEVIRLNAGRDLFPQMRFGYAVDVSGPTIVVGAAFDTYLGSASGSAFVFTRDATFGWTRADFLLASDGTSGDRFGTDAAIDGERIVVGAPLSSLEGSNAGAAYIFEPDGFGRQQQVARLSASDVAPGAKFGSAVAISGETIVVSAPGASAGMEANVGAAYIFVRDPGAPQGWRQADKVMASDGDAGDMLGIDVAIDGDRIVAGARDDEDAAGFRSGAVYLFDRVAPGVDDWAEVTKITASDADDLDSLGYSVGISGDLIVAGAPFDEDAGNLAGAMYVFRLGGCRADLTRDGVVDVFDLLAYLAGWFAGDADADVTGDDAVDVFDLLVYLEAWFAESGEACV